MIYERRLCVLCGKSAPRSLLKQTTTRKKWNVVLTASLSLAGFLDGANVGYLVQEISTRSKYICRSHVVLAAQFLSAEVVAAGKKPLSYYVYPSTAGKLTAAITTQIPESLVEAINQMSNGDFFITEVDVRSFINAARKNYYGTSVWPLHQAKEDEPEEGLSIANACESDGRTEPVNVKVEVQEDEEMIAFDGVDDEASSRTAEVSENEPGTSGSDSSCDGDVGDKDSAVLQKYFIVKGELLMKLFRFCPECGTKLRKARLKAKGAAAVVRFVCQKCNVKQKGKWQSQELDADRMLGC